MSKGGTWYAFNLKLAHELCNRIRSSRDVLDSREFVQAKLANPSKAMIEHPRGAWLRNYIEQKREAESMTDRLEALLRSEGVLK